MLVGQVLLSKRISMTAVSALAEGFFTLPRPSSLACWLAHGRQTMKPKVHPLQSTVLYCNSIDLFYTIMGSST